MQWLMLQQNIPQDFVISTGIQYTVKEFVNLAFKKLDISLRWEGNDINEKAFDATTNRCLIEIDPRYFRPTEVDTLLGNSQKAHKVLGWSPKITINQLIEEMIKEDLILAENEHLILNKNKT